MTTYKEIFGKQIKQLSSDPTDAEAEGQVWYNTTAGVFKTVLSVAAVVAVNTGRASELLDAEHQTAEFIFWWV